ncbi:MAG: sugar-binding protein [Bacteroidales bacterium]
MRHFYIILVVLAALSSNLKGQFTPPDIDGEIDEIWNTTPSYPLTKLIKNNLGPIPDAEDISASFRSLWDENNFYLLVEVVDDVIFNGISSPDHQNDNLEVYFDINNSKLSQYDGIDDDQIRFIPGVDTINSKRGVIADDIEFSYKQTSEGYRFEMRFPWNSLTSESFSAAEGVEIGFDILVTDNDNSSTKNYIYAWSSPENNAWQNTQIFGILKLNPDGSTVKVENSYLPPEHDAYEIDESKVEVTLYVDKNHPDASDSNPGDNENLPLKTIFKALDIASDSLGAGKATKILIYPGTYREYGLYPVLKGNANSFLNTELVIEGTEKGKVIISGSEIVNDGWSSEGNNTYSRSWTWNIVPDKPWGEHGPDPEIAHQREMIFVGGYWMEQVMKQADLKTNSFYVDNENDLVYVKVADSINFTTEDKEISLHGDGEDLPWPPKRLFTVPMEKDKVVLRNLVFEHANMRLSESALKISGWKVLIDNCIVRWNNGVGMNAGRDIKNLKLTNSTFSNNGGSGITTWGLQDTYWADNETSYNNWRGAQGNFHSYAVGGVKFHHTRNIELVNHKSIGNMCPGLWTDLEIIGAVWDNCTVEDNYGPGMLIEISSDIMIKNSIIRHNTPGIRCHSSHDVTFDNCLIKGNTIQFAVYRDHRDFTDVNWTKQFDGRVWDKTPNNWVIKNCTIHAEDNPEWQEKYEKRIPNWMHYTNPGYQPFWHFSHSDYMQTFFGGADIAYNNNTWTHDAVEKPFKDDQDNAMNVDAWELWISSLLSNDDALMLIDSYAKNDDASSLTISQMQNAGGQDIISENLEEYKIVVAEFEGFPDVSVLQDAIVVANAFAIIREFAENDDASGLSIEQLMDCGVTFRSDRLEYYKTAIANASKEDLSSIAALQELINLTTKKEDRELESYLNVYPNPVGNTLIINTSIQMKEISIINASGKQVVKIENGRENIDVSSLEPGFYFLYIQTEENMLVRKIMKK